MFVYDKKEHKHETKGRWGGEALSTYALTHPTQALHVPANLKGAGEAARQHGLALVRGFVSDGGHGAEEGEESCILR